MKDFTKFFKRCQIVRSHISLLWHYFSKYFIACTVRTCVTLNKRTPSWLGNYCSWIQKFQSAEIGIGRQTLVWQEERSAVCYHTRTGRKLREVSEADISWEEPPAYQVTIPDTSSRGLPHAHHSLSLSLCADVISYYSAPWCQTNPALIRRRQPHYCRVSIFSRWV